MKNLHRFLALSLSLSLLHSVSQAAESPNLHEILQKHLDAMGGLNNWNQIESIRLNGTIERGDQVVDICIVKKRPNQIRATVTVPIPGKEDEAFQVIRAHDGKSAWTATRLAGAPDMEKTALSEEAAAELLADAGVLPPLIKLWREGADLELAGTKIIDGRATLAIHATTENIPGQYKFYLSDESFLVLQYENSHPTKGTTVTQLQDYTEQQNIRIPRVNIIQSEQTGYSIMTTSSIKIGVGIYEEYFEAGDHTPTTAKL